MHQLQENQELMITALTFLEAALLLTALCNPQTPERNYCELKVQFVSFTFTSFSQIAKGYPNFLGIERGQ